MKKFLILFFLIHVSFFGILMSPAIAAGGEMSQHAPTNEVLEFSLSRLKESMQKTIQDNECLALENEELRESVEDFQRVKAALVEKKDAISGRFQSSGYQQEKLRFTEFGRIKNRRERTRALIDIFKHDVARLRDEIFIWDKGLDEREFNSEKQMLLKRKKESSNNFSKEEKKLKSLMRENEALLAVFETLKNRQDELVQELGGL